MEEKLPVKSNILKGIIASPGTAIGKVFLIEEEDIAIIPKKIPKQLIKKEVTRYNDALIHVRDEMLSTKDKILKSIGKQHAPLLDAYLMMLDDPLLNRDVARRITEETVNAEYALWITLERIFQSFESIDDEYFRERKNDVQEIGKRILRHLMGQQRKSLSEAKEDSIIVAHNLSPSETVSLKDHKISGFAVNIGGKTSHISLLAQGLGIPAVVGLKNITRVVNNDDTIIIDGNEGIIIINPDEDTLQNYKRVHELLLREQEELEKLRNLPAETEDGHKVTLAANLDLSEELKSVLLTGAEGVGLLRTEFIYMNRTTLPTEEEHYQLYSNIVKKVLPYQVIIRTMDLGGDKLAQFNIDNVTPENNPFLGLRAIRLCLKYPDIFKTQLRAILRASADGKVKIMFPMISGVGELRQAKKILEEVKIELKTQNIAFDEKVEVGAMIEIPSAAITADLIAVEADFLSIGTNDLIQYTLAVDRMNESVAFMYEPLHLSILRLVKNIIDGGHNAGKWVGMCGEMAGDSTFTAILLGLGLNEFSMPPNLIPKIKKIIRSTKYSEAKELAKEIINSNDHDIIIRTLHKYNL